jgi:hypothetical protein
MSEPQPSIDESVYLQKIVDEKSQSLKSLLKEKITEIQKHLIFAEDVRLFLQQFYIEYQSDSRDELNPSLKNWDLATDQVVCYYQGLLKFTDQPTNLKSCAQIERLLDFKILKQCPRLLTKKENYLDPVFKSIPLPPGKIIFYVDRKRGRTHRVKSGTGLSIVCVYEDGSYTEHNFPSSNLKDHRTEVSFVNGELNFYLMYLRDDDGFVSTYHYDSKMALISHLRIIVNGFCSLIPGGYLFETINTMTVVDEKGSVKWVLKVEGIMTDVKIFENVIMFTEYQPSSQLRYLFAVDATTGIVIQRLENRGFLRGVNEQTLGLVYTVYENKLFLETWDGLVLNKWDCEQSKNMAIIGNEVISFK